jgi:hypothetical protein
LVRALAHVFHTNDFAEASAHTRIGFHDFGGDQP